MDKQKSSTDKSSQRISSRRRRLLTALGTAAIPALAGCTGSPSDQPTSSPTDTMQPTSTPPQQQQQQQQDAEIGSRFGFVGTGDTSPPVEPDHTIDLLLQERENMPIPEFYFEPTGLTIDVGDTVQFNLPTPHHNVNAYHPGFGYTQRVPDEVPPFSSPILTAGDYWVYTFEQEGVHDIMCAPHELFGMVGRIVVGSATGPGAQPVGEAPAPSPQSRPPEFTAALVLTDSAMDPQNIVEQGPVSWSDIAPKSKRPMLKPVEGGE